MRNSILYENPIKYKDFPISIGIYNSNKGFSSHWHERLELLLFITNGNIVLDDTTYELESGDLIFINCNRLHASQNNRETVQYYVLRIDPSFFIDVDFENHPIETIIKNDEFIKKCFEEIYSEMHTMDEGYQMKAMGITYELIVHILRNYKAKLSSTDIIVKETKGRKIERILDYITKYYNENITTASISEQFHLNEQYFCRLFKKETGMSLTNYLNKLRIEKAILFLENADISITEVASNAGFDDSNYFSRIFKKQMKVTPREYKMKLSKRS